MNLDYFFIYSELIEKKNLDIGFDLYGMGHLIWLAVILAAAIAVSAAYVKADKKVRAKTKRIFAIAILISEILKDTILAIAGANMIEYLPLHLCSFTILAMLVHSYSHYQQVTGQLFAYALFPGATAALLFCNWTEYPFLNYMNIHSFLFHGWIVIYFVMLYRSREIKPSYRGLWMTVLTMLIVSVPVYIFNLIFDTNYLFLNEASEGSPLVIIWELFGTRFGAPGYLAGIVIMVLIVFHILYVVYKLLNAIGVRKRGI